MAEKSVQLIIMCSDCFICFEESRRTDCWERAHYRSLFYYYGHFISFFRVTLDCSHLFTFFLHYYYFLSSFLSYYIYEKCTRLTWQREAPREYRPEVCTQYSANNTRREKHQYSTKENCLRTFSFFARVIASLWQVSRIFFEYYRIRGANSKRTIWEYPTWRKILKQYFYLIYDDKGPPDKFLL